MHQEGVARPLGNADIARVLSPLLFFVAHLLYLALWSTEPFLNKWLDGSFTFFIALVLCNIIRARVVAGAPSGHEQEQGAQAAGGPGEGDAAAPEVPDGADSAGSAGGGGERHQPR